jgi:uncharacterized ferritin-like protein (DUF455 family)
MLHIALAREKLAAAPKCVSEALAGTYEKEIPQFPARDIRTVPIAELRGKPGLSQLEGQARLLHDVGNIELQAMELAFRTLVEFPEAPPLFRVELAALVLSEAKHFSLCLDGLENLGFPWGTWPGHLTLWSSVSSEDTLLDRILIVHRYLEGSGLDAGHGILQRLTGFDNKKLKPILDVIVREELEHVQFGSRWFNAICELENRDPAAEFRIRLKAVQDRVPKRLEKVNVKIRKQAGFSDFELDCLDQMQAGLL